MEKKTCETNGEFASPKNAIESPWMALSVPRWNFGINHSNRINLEQVYFCF